MLKNKQTQFAIRKLTTGTAAILLSLACLGSTASPVLAAQTSSEIAADNSVSYDQKINYVDENNNRIHSVTAFTLTKPGTIKANEIQAAIISNLPTGYELKSNAVFDKDVIITDNDPADINVDVVKKNDTTTPTDKTYQQKIEYYDETGSFVSVVIAFELADKETISPDKIKEAIDAYLPADYELLPGYVYPTESVEINGQDPADIRVKVRKKAVSPEPGETESKNFVRSIHITDHNGEEQPVVKQTVTYERSAKDTDWQLKNGSWDAHKLTAVAGYQSKVRYAYESNLAEQADTVKSHDFPATIAASTDLTNLADEHHVYVTYEPNTTIPETPIEPEVPVLPEDPALPDDPILPDTPNVSDKDDSMQTPEVDNNETANDETSTISTSTPSSNTSQSTTTAADIASTDETAGQDSNLDLTTLPQTSAESFYASVVGVILTIISIGAGWFISRKEKE